MAHHQQYPADSATWLTESQDGAHFLPKMVQRRAKRIIPEVEKDDKYWEKRKRNNMAAKRSRENKRKLEVDIRQKMNYLEEDNALLRKEIALIKAKFGISPDQSLLTPEERSQCMQEVKAAKAAAEASERASCGDGVYPVSLLGVPASPLDMNRKSDQSDSDEHDRSLADDNSRPETSHLPVSSVYGGYNPPMAWGTSHHQYPANIYNDNQRQHNMNNGYGDKPHNNYARYAQPETHFSRNPYEYYTQYTSQGQSMFTNAEQLQGVSSPADLTTRAKRSEHEAMLQDLANKNGGPEGAQTPNSLTSGMTGNMHIDSTGLHAQLTRSQDIYNQNIDSLDPEGSMVAKVEPNMCRRTDLRRENVELKERLSHLTTRVEKMKSIVMKD